MEQQKELENKVNKLKKSVQVNQASVTQQTPLLFGYFTWTLWRYLETFTTVAAFFSSSGNRTGHSGFRRSAKQVWF